MRYFQRTVPSHDNFAEQNGAAVFYRIIHAECEYVNFVNSNNLRVKIEPPRIGEGAAVAHTKVQMQLALLSAYIGTGCYGHVPMTKSNGRVRAQTRNYPYWLQVPHTAVQYRNL